MLTFVLPRRLLLLFPRLLLLPGPVLFRLRSLVLTLLRLPWVPDPPAPGRLWFPPLIDGCVPADGRDVLGLLPAEDRFEVLGDDRLELLGDERPALCPPPPERPPPPPPRMRCANASSDTAAR